MLPKMEGVNQIDTLSGLVYVRDEADLPLQAFFVVADGAYVPGQELNLRIESFVRMNALPQDLQDQIRKWRDSVLLNSP